MEYKPTSAAIYTELNANIELATKWCHILLVNVDLVGVIVPPFLVSYVNYFIFDRGDEAFMLSWPLMYVGHLFDVRKYK